MSIFVQRSYKHNHCRSIPWMSFTGKGPILGKIDYTPNFLLNLFIYFPFLCCIYSTRLSIPKRLYILSLNTSKKFWCLLQSYLDSYSSFSDSGTTLIETQLVNSIHPLLPSVYIYPNLKINQRPLRLVVSKSLTPLLQLACIISSTTFFGNVSNALVDLSNWHKSFFLKLKEFFQHCLQTSLTLGNKVWIHKISRRLWVK